MRAGSNGVVSPSYGLHVPLEASIFQLVAQVIETVVPVRVNGCQM